MVAKSKLLTTAAVALFLTGCDLGPSNPRTEMYVRVPSPTAPKFTTTLATILEEQGLSVSTGRTTEPEPRTTFVLEAKSWSVRVWAQNAVLDPAASAACGYPPQVSGERTQYIVSVQRRSPLWAKRAQDFFTDLRKKLVRRGYIVAERQMPCERLTV